MDEISTLLTGEALLKIPNVIYVALENSRGERERESKAFLNTNHCKPDSSSFSTLFYSFFCLVFVFG